MTKRQKLPGSLEKRLQKLVEEARKTIEDPQKKILEELHDKIKLYKSKGYGISKYEKIRREILKKRLKAFDEKWEDHIYRIEKI